MAIGESHGVVVVRMSTRTIHWPNYGASEHQAESHGIVALQTGDWELFPNLDTAMEAEADYKPCRVCFSHL